MKALNHLNFLSNKRQMALTKNYLKLARILLYLKNTYITYLSCAILTMPYLFQLYLYKKKAKVAFWH